MKVVVFGLGYVGTVSAACLAASGHDVWGVDPDRTKVESIVGGRSPVLEPGLTELVADTVRAHRLHAVTSASDAVDGAEASLLCVGTPSTNHGGANLEFLRRAVADLAQCLVAGAPSPSGFHAVVVRSTVPPGTVERLGDDLRARLGGSGPSVGVAMCPEFLREGSGIADFRAPPFTVIGTRDPRVASTLEGLLGFVDCPTHVVDVPVAEALKYASNAFHAMKVSFTNEMGLLFRRLGVDSRSVMSLFCQDDRLNISSMYLRPGFAFGGSCLPKDLRSLLHLARSEDVDLPALSGVLATNERMVMEAVERVVNGEGRTVALLGLSFKSGSDDLRESPYVDLAETLLGKGYEVRIHDPSVHPVTLVGANRAYVESRLPHLRRLLTATATEALDGADVAIVASSCRHLAGAVLDAAPRRVIDLDGRLGPGLEAMPGYEGVAW